MTASESWPIFMSALVFFAVAYVAHMMLQEYDEAAQKLGAEEIAKGDSGLAELYIQMSPQTFFVLRVMGAVLVFLVSFSLAGTLISVIATALAYAFPGIRLNQLRQARVRKVETQLVEGLELLGNSLKSGLTIQQAAEMLVKEFPPPISQEFALVLAETRLGVDFNDALANMADRLKSNIVQILAAGVAITKRVGGDLTVIFNNIAQTIREQANIEGKLNAVTAQGRFQGLILGFMPFALMVLLYFVDRSHVETLFGYTIGTWAVALVVMMVILAQMWIQKLLDIDV